MTKMTEYRDEKHKRECQQKREWYVRNKQRVIDRSKEDKQKLRKWFDEWKSGFKCIKCGMDHLACLDFHHKDATIKELAIAHTLRMGWAKDRIVAEAEKCDVLCANCHRILHWQERQ